LNELAKSNSEEWGEKVKFVNFSVDSSYEKAKEHAVIDVSNVSNLHVGTSTADLEYGASNIPRIAIFNKQGELVFLGHPKKVMLKDSIETLIKGENLVLAPEILEEDNYSAPKPPSSMSAACETETGVYSDELSLPEVREEMEKFTA